MNKYNVIFEVHHVGGIKEQKIIVVEAGNKKLATIRGMMEINKLDPYKGLYKNVLRVVEVDK